MSQNIKIVNAIGDNMKNGGRKINSYTEIVDKTKKLIMQEIEEINCGKVADYNGYSMKQMNRIFMAETEMSIGSYIHDKRMSQAIMDLRYTDIPIIEIAQKNGFSTQESFTREFKKVFHVTPFKFRQDCEWKDDVMKHNLLEVIEETSHEFARKGSVDLPDPQISFIHKHKTLWYSISRNINDLFPHNFYVECKKNNYYDSLYNMSNDNPVGGAYLTHVYQDEKFTSLTLGFEEEYCEGCRVCKKLGLDIITESYTTAVSESDLSEMRKSEVADMSKLDSTVIRKSNAIAMSEPDLTATHESEVTDMSELDLTVMPESDYMVVNVPPYKNYELGAHVLAAWNVFSDFDYKSYGLKRNLNHAPIYEWDSEIDGYTLYFPVSRNLEED